MIEIKLTTGEVSIVDDIDANLILHKWRSPQNTKHKYAQRCYWDGKRTHGTSIHREIMKRVVGRDLLKHEIVDHINGNGLDNRRANLRLCTKQQNSQNRSLKSTNKLGLKGVQFVKGYKSPYRAKIILSGKHVYLGHYATPEEAHEAYCKAAQFYFGEFWRAA